MKYSTPLLAPRCRVGCQFCASVSPLSPKHESRSLIKARPAPDILLQYARYRHGLPAYDVSVCSTTQIKAAPGLINNHLRNHQGGCSGRRGGILNMYHVFAMLDQEIIQQASIGS